MTSRELQDSRNGDRRQELLIETLAPDGPDRPALLPLGIEQLRPYPDQPRKHFDQDELRALGEDMLARGQTTPLVVNPADDPPGTFFIEDGHRRHAAAGLTGIETLLCVVVRRGLADVQRFELQLVTSLQRASLRPMEEAVAYRRLLEAKACSAKKLAADLHLSEPKLCKALKLLRIDQSLWPHIDAGDITREQAYRLSSLNPPEQHKTAERLLTKKNGQAPAQKDKPTAAIVAGGLTFTTAAARPAEELLSELKSFLVTARKALDRNPRLTAGELAALFTEKNAAAKLQAKASAAAEALTRLFDNEGRK